MGATRDAGDLHEAQGLMGFRCPYTKTLCYGPKPRSSTAPNSHPSYPLTPNTLNPATPEGVEGVEWRTVLKHESHIP